MAEGCLPSLRLLNFVGFARSTMSEDEKPIYRGFDELARKLFPELGVTESGDSASNWESFVEQQRRSRVEVSQVPGMVRHYFDTAWKWNDATTSLARQLGDEFFEARIPERWPVTPHPELVRRVESCQELLHTVSPAVVCDISQPAIFEFRVALEDFPQLPTAYAFKGGVARKALARALHLNVNTSSVRDMDIVFLGQQRNEELEKELAKTFMHDDWVFAKKSPIEMQPNCKAYFKTREFTVNQVILHGPSVMCTALCLCDFISGTIRPTHNHLKRHDGAVDGIVAAKAIRFYAEGRGEGRPMRLDPKVTQLRRPIKHFHLAIHLARALEQSEVIALDYLNECLAYRLTKLRFDGTVADAIRRLCKAAQIERSFFPPYSNAPDTNS